MDIIESGLAHPILGPLYAFLAGILTSASPCALGAIPLVIGHMADSEGRGRVKDMFVFLLGMASALTLTGVVAGALGRSLLLSFPWLRWVAGLALVGGGLAYTGIFSRNAVCRVALPGISQTKTRTASGLVLGALYGVSASPCATPALLAILALVASTGSIGKGALLLLAYSLGQSVLVAAAGLATSQFRAFLENQRNAAALDALRKAGGAAIALVGVYVLVRPYI